MFANFTRVVFAGTSLYGGNRYSVFVKIKHTDGKLSITGAEGMRSSRDCESCGQITNTLRAETFAPAVGVDAERLATLWDRWHLNDMRAGCEHQRAEWVTNREITLHPLKWGPAFNALRFKVENAEATVEEYAEYQRIRPLVFALTIGYNRPRHPALWGEAGNELLANEFAAPEKTERRLAGSTSYREHPDGLLGKPCPECGYKYGAAWLREEVPADVLEWLYNLPETTNRPAWI